MREFQNVASDKSNPAPQYAIVPLAMMRDKRLTARDLRGYAVIDHLARRARNDSPPLALIARLMGLRAPGLPKGDKTGIAHASRTMNRLHGFGYIKLGKRETGRWPVSTYTIRFRTELAQAAASPPVANPGNHQVADDGNPLISRMGSKKESSAYADDKKGAPPRAASAAKAKQDSAPQLPDEEIEVLVDQYNGHRAEHRLMPEIIGRIDARRKRKLSALWHDLGPDHWGAFLDSLACACFLKRIRPDFDWCIRRDSARKIINGNFETDYRGIYLSDYEQAEQEIAEQNAFMASRLLNTMIDITPRKTGS